MKKEIQLNNQRILISRTDSIGDVVLTLPICLYLKKKFPNCTLVFLGNEYTKSVVSCFDEIDEIVIYSQILKLPKQARVTIFEELKIDICLHVFPRKEIAQLIKKANIPIRVGTSHRAYHLLTCNYRLNFSRKNSDLHESQLNFKLLQAFGLNQVPDLNEISQLISESIRIPAIENSKFEMAFDSYVLHAKSQGSAIEWPLENYNELAQTLLDRGCKVAFTGTEKEGELIRNFIPSHPNCFDLTGKMSLSELICFISKSKALLACSTGPLHLAGICGIKTVGLFSSRKPIHPGRWRALGANVTTVVYDDNCPTCKKGKTCLCLEKISVEKVESIFI
jgi:ADP-heptose:LPS heptosyltransferase